jgi:predicted transcriptional regulator
MQIKGRDSVDLSFDILLSLYQQKHPVSRYALVYMAQTSYNSLAERLVRFLIPNGLVIEEHHNNSKQTTAISMYIVIDQERQKQ